MAGCVTPSWTASAVSRRGPDRSSVASVAAAVRDSPSAGLSDLTSPISRSTPAAIPAASARSGPWAISISYLYHILMYLTAPGPDGITVDRYPRHPLCR